MKLREVVEKYLALAGGYARPVPLGRFGLSRDETERIFAALDEDYHISRFIHLTCAEGARYTINGFDHTHISIDPGIQAAL